jgi:aerobic-type carbon monoxide dehydrogenase small subunit (CoxS/CutS family)
MDSTIAFTVNGKKQTVTTDSRRLLLDVLREDLQLTGTKYGCGEGSCGACTVLIDGKRAFSCRKSIDEVEGKSVVTIEGIADGEKLHPVQEAFVTENSFQCGFCTTGMILNTVALLSEKPQPTDAEIVAWTDRNICRCCTYPRIVQAVRRAAEATQKAGR